MEKIKYIEHLLKQTAYLIPYLLMAVSFLSVILPYLGFGFNYATWGNAGGFSILTDLFFIAFLSFDKNNCQLTKNLPFALLFINIVNIISNEFFKQYHELYSQFYEIIIFSITLMIALILWINKKLKW